MATTVLSPGWSTLIKIDRVSASYNIYFLIQLIYQQVAQSGGALLSSLGGGQQAWWQCQGWCQHPREELPLTLVPVILAECPSSFLEFWKGDNWSSLHEFPLKITL